MLSGNKRHIFSSMRCKTVWILTIRCLARVYVYSHTARRMYTHCKTRFSSMKCKAVWMPFLICSANGGWKLYMI